MKQAATVQWADVDDGGKPPVDELSQKIVALLTMGNASERAVLALDKDARVHHHGYQEASLTFGEAVRRDRLHALLVDLIDVPALGGRWQRHMNSSASP